MASVYSERFLSTIVADSWVYYTCPAGKRLVVRNLVSSNEQAIGSFVRVYLGGVPVVYLRYQAAPDSRSVDVRAVGYAGDQLALYLSAGGMSGFISGYLFDDPSGRTEAPGGQHVLARDQVAPWLQESSGA